MLKLAICDDEIQSSKHIVDFVDGWMKNKNVFYEGQVFSGSKELLYEIEDGTDYDLLLLDIEMTELDGIQLAERIKKYLPNVLVVFITSHEKYVYESFKVQPFRFIPKRYMEHMLPLALEDAVELWRKQRGKYLWIENREKIEKVPIDRIVYIWRREKYVYIEKTDGGKAKVRKTLKQIYGELPEGDFVWINSGYICNLLQIARIDKGDVVLTNGMRLKVSRARLPEVKNVLRKYWI